MPFTPSMDLEIERIVSLAGMVLFPICLCISLPVFLYSLVLEKEMKLLENMKINGMKMKNYWLVNFSFFFLIYVFTSGLFWLSGRYIFNVTVFAKTG
jgi:hypothetical protein